VSRALTTCALFLVAFLATSCGDLLSTHPADAVVKIEADDQPAVLQTRQEILASASTWGGTRVGEETTRPDETALEFSLPGQNLEIALGALGRLDARVVATKIDVEAQQIDRAQVPSTVAGSTSAPDPADSAVRLRVEVAQAPAVGAGGFLRFVMAIFSLVGMAATAIWVTNWVKGRSQPKAPRRARRIENIATVEDPPTQETPRVPPQW